MRLLGRTIKYRLKQNYVTLKGLLMLFIALAGAVIPLITVIGQTDEARPVNIGWADKDNSEYSEKLLKSVESYELLNITAGTEASLTGELKAGRLEALFIVNEGFEQSIKSGEYEDTMTMLKSPYSSVAGVVSEGVVAQVMHLWLAQYSAEVAKEYGGSRAFNEVFEGVVNYMDNPMMTIERIGTISEYTQPDPRRDAAFKSLYISAALCCLFLLVNAASSDNTNSLEQRLESQNFTKEYYRFGLGIADVLFFLLCALPGVITLAVLSELSTAALMLIMFALYLFAYAGVAALLCKIKSKTVHMMVITAIGVSNFAYGSLIIDMPTRGIVPKLVLLLPSRWLTSFDMFGAGYAVLGLAACALVYNGLALLHKKRKFNGKEIL